MSIADITTVKFMKNGEPVVVHHVDESDRDHLILSLMVKNWALAQGSEHSETLLRQMLEVTEEDFEGSISALCDLWEKATKRQSKILFHSMDSPDLTCVPDMDALRLQVENLK